MTCNNYELQQYYLQRNSGRARSRRRPSQVAASPDLQYTSWLAAVLLKIALNLSGQFCSVSKTILFNTPKCASRHSTKQQPEICRGPQTRSEEHTSELQSPMY